MIKINKRVLASDLDWTGISGENKYHVASYIFAINTLFEDLHVDAQDIRIPTRQGMIDNQIVLEVLKEKGVSEAKAAQALPSIAILAADYFLRAYQADPSSDRCMPGAKNLFRVFSRMRIPIGVLTGNFGKIAKARVDSTGLGKFVSAIAGGDMALSRGGLVPVLQNSLEKVLRRKVSAEDLVVLDDAPLGVKTMKEADIFVIGVASGHATEQQLLSAGADIVIPNLTDGYQDVLECFKESYRVF